MRTFGLCLLCLISAQALIAQTASTDCTFEDGRQIGLQYNTGKSEEIRNGKLWTPGGAPMVLFAQAPLTLGAATITPGAYTVYIIPAKKEWTLIINKNVNVGSSYDPGQDLARGSMDLGEVDHATKQPQLAFAHVGPKDCSLRIYYGKVGAFVEFKEP